MHIRSSQGILLPFLAILISFGCGESEPPPPNIILLMADDMGWGQTGYYNHPLLKTPNLDAMAAAGLQFDRFYAGAPNCSPTRATVLTGRSNDRTGVENHGFALRRQEVTLSRALHSAGYATGHFGKWHLNGLRGPGVPILDSDNHNPGVFGFETWLSVTNFFERDPLMSRNGLFVDFEGDSSEIIVEEALKFIDRQSRQDLPFLAVVWFGTPHSPWIASDDDRSDFYGLDEKSQHHYGELVAMDRSIGTLRTRLREMEIEQNTLVWFTSDNGGLPGIKPGTVGELRGFKGSLYEGGIRVPAIIEWPAAIAQPRKTAFPAVSMDIFPTLAEVAGLEQTVMKQPQDGISLIPLFSEDLERREQPIGFRHTGRLALINNEYKIVLNDRTGGAIELYNLSSDPGETTDLASQRPQLSENLQKLLSAWDQSVTMSAEGGDYAIGDFDKSESQPRFWMTAPEYEPYLKQFKLRSEYADRIK